MSTQTMSDLLVDLSTEEQQLLAGGQFADRDRDDDEGEGKEGTEATVGRTRLYRIRSRAIVSVTKLR